jgi:hypothetical protein
MAEIPFLSPPEPDPREKDGTSLKNGPVKKKPGSFFNKFFSRTS